MFRELDCLEIEAVSGGTEGVTPTMSNGQPGNGPGEVTSQEAQLTNMAHNNTHITNTDNVNHRLVGTDSNGNYVEFRDRDEDGWYDEVWKMDDYGNVLHSENGIYWHSHPYQDLFINFQTPQNVNP